MVHGFLIASIISTCYQGVKNLFESTIPAENWGNRELYHKDLMSGVSVEQRMKNLKNGKYKLVESHPKPHRDSVSGKIIIENNLLYKNDLQKYGAHQTMKWVKQGKYNLTPEELGKENKRIQEELKRLYNL